MKAAEQRKASSTEIDSTGSPVSSVSAADAQVRPVDGAVAGRPSNLDVRAQSALLHEAFEAPDLPEPAGPTFSPSPQRTSFVARYGRRAVKSALGLCVVVIAGVGPVQRFLEISSVEAVVNARLVSLRSPIDGRIEDFAP